MQNSFNEDTFLRHLFYVNALTRKDSFPADIFAESVRGRLAARGLIVRDRTPKPGDLLFFDLGTSSKTLVAVAERVGKDKVTFIAPIGFEIRRGTLTISRKGNKAQDTRLLDCGRASSKNKKRACRAGELFAGSADIELVAKTFK